MIENDFEQYLFDKLEQKKSNHLYRELPLFEGLIDFCSNDYLGFAQFLPTFLTQNHSNFPSGATGSRLISGNSTLAENTEKNLAHFHQENAALIFNCGYMANVALFSSIAEKDDLIIYDELIHASVHDGMRLSLATRYKFKHNDLADLEKKLTQGNGRKFVAIESVYSMDGDMAPMKEIAILCKKYHAALIIDEAHSVGIWGEKGSGLTNELELQGQIFARVITFGKAIGLHGAAILGSNNLKNFLINHARAFIYTTALPPQTYHDLNIAYQELPKANRTKLFENISYFIKKQKEIKVVSSTCNRSPIQAILIPGNENALNLAKYLQKKGFAVKAILSPTVKSGAERIRICLHSHNEITQIDQLFEHIRIYYS